MGLSVCMRVGGTRMRVAPSGTSLVIIDYFFYWGVGGFGMVIIKPRA